MNFKKMFSRKKAEDNSPIKDMKKPSNIFKTKDENNIDKNDAVLRELSAVRKHLNSLSDDMFKMRLDSVDKSIELMKLISPEINIDEKRMEIEQRLESEKSGLFSKFSDLKIPQQAAQILTPEVSTIQIPLHVDGGTMELSSEDLFELPELSEENIPEKTEKEYEKKTTRKKNNKN